MKVNIAILLLFLCFPSVYAQDMYKAFDLSIHYGANIAHSSDVKEVKSTYPYALQADFYRLRTDSGIINTCKCFPQTGFSLSLFDYGNRDLLGYGLNASFFIAPVFPLNTKFSFSPKAMAGLAFATNPYHPVDNFRNQAYSLPVNGYLGVAMRLNYHVNRRSQLFTHLHYNHISNGGIKDPNKGLNFVSLGLGISFYNSGLFFPKINPRKFDRSKSLQEWKATFLQSSRTVRNGEKTRYLVMGVEFSYLKQFSNFAAYTFAVEGLYDDVLREHLERRDGWAESQYRSGFTGGMEFLLGKFRLSHRIGVYMYDPSNYHSLFYHRHGLMYMLNRDWSVGINMKAHKQVANFLDLRLSYRLK